MNIFLWLFAVQCFICKSDVQVGLIDGSSYNQTCLIIGCSPWHLRLKYFHDGHMYHAAVPMSKVTDILTRNKVIFEDEPWNPAPMISQSAQR
jgi:hypothetical protein